MATTDMQVQGGSAVKVMPYLVLGVLMRWMIGYLRGVGNRHAGG